MRSIVRFLHLSIFYLTESVDDQLLGLFFKPNEYFVVFHQVKIFNLAVACTKIYIDFETKKKGLNFNYRLCSNLMRFKS